jgi:hypothetical protein
MLLLLLLLLFLEAVVHVAVTLAEFDELAVSTLRASNWHLVRPDTNPRRKTSAQKDPFCARSTCIASSCTATSLQVCPQK